MALAAGASCVIARSASATAPRPPPGSRTRANGHLATTRIWIWLRSSKSATVFRANTGRWRSRGLNRRRCSSRAVAASAEGAGGAAEMRGGRATSVAQFLSALYKFSRPHTMLGTFVSVISVSLLALQGDPVTKLFVQGAVTALVPALLMNVCIVGMNQLYDVEIDKVNKPYLPLASGEFDMSTGVAIVTVTGIASLAMGLISGSIPLICTLAGSLALGIVYSTDMPFLRWKKYPVLAAGCILAVRAVAVQLGFYLHAFMYTPSVQLDGVGFPKFATLLQGPLGFTVAFMLFFSIVIALFKDIPDTKGDIKEDVRTLSVVFGVNKVFWTCIALLEVAYVGAIAYCASRGFLWSNVLVMAGHALMGALLWRRARTVDLKDIGSITDCYMYVWKLFYLEYLFIPLFR